MNQRVILTKVIEQVRVNGFWFIDIPRTSSSSIRAELGRIYGIPYGKANLIEREFSMGQIFEDHLPASAMMQVFGPEIWDRLFTFSLVRNPWDRVLSMYHHRRKVRGIPQAMSFRDYVIELNCRNWGVEGSIFQYRWHYFGSADYVCGANDEILVDFVGHFENRTEDIDRIASRIGAPGLGDLTIQRASPSGQHYSRWYEQDTKDMIKAIYKRDIELFHYEF
ncbi:MAG: sulfotransferase family 2 domain-containing protein [Gammaproteobacteria bacterium]|nr:sulfotransferase family 2 domain-containing protein [Gammaproteobacteria bacterium]